MNLSDMPSRSCKHSPDAIQKGRKTKNKITILEVKLVWETHTIQTTQTSMTWSEIFSNKFECLAFDIKAQGLDFMR